MIFVTVGAQMPFDRLVHAVDSWAGRNGRTDVFAQIGDTSRPPRHIECVPRLDPIAFRSRALNADLIVTHAGMGTIITGLELGKPMIVMPRRADLRETRNDHQFDTARVFSNEGRVAVAWSELALADQLDRADGAARPTRIDSYASIELLSALRSFVLGDEVVSESTSPATGFETAPTHRISPARSRDHRRAA
jgi:UDP-N-acetylglucosamine transferase subunit ALG13